MFLDQRRHFHFGLLNLFSTEALAAALADRYSIERLIGEGGMAKVFLARDLRHNRRVAVKVLRPDLGAIVGLGRFQAEIQVTANLQHPNLLPLFDSGAAGELLFYVMPFIEGESLRARLEREKQLPVDETVRIATAIAGALDYAHRQGVVHRDLKPENILIQEGQPLVADFGIALAISNAGGGRLTETGLSLGTPRYMSPEQAVGDRAIDGRSDIYSLGALTYEMLTGEPPHVGSTAQAIIARVLTERPRSIRATRANVPAHLEAVVDRALEKLAADRWATARDFAEALSGARHIERSSTFGLPSAHALPSVGKRWREVAAWTLVAGLAIATSYFAIHATHTVATPASTAEFEVLLPDSVRLPAARTAALMAISRDGQTVVFVGQKGSESPRLYSRRLGDRVVHEIRGSEGALSPMVSPDGKEVLFSLISAPGIKRVDIGGGVPRTFTDSAISNGGRLQLSWREGNQVLMVKQGPRMRPSLVVVDAATRDEKVLVSSDTSGREWYGSPDVLPGGKAALITIGGAQHLDDVTIGTVTIPEGKITDLGIHGLSPHYSETGHLIYGKPEGSLYAMRFDPRALLPLGKETLLAEKVSADRFGNVPFAVADNGAIAFIEGPLGAGPMQPMIITRSGVKRALGVQTFMVDPRISPDGKEVAFTKGYGLVRLGEVDKPDIWRLDVATGQLRRVTSDRASERPIWSRDGTEIFFSKYPGDSVEYAIGLSAGAQPRRLFRGPGQLGTSDFGRQHAILGVGGSGDRPSGDLWFAPMDSLDKARPFATESYAEWFPRISPDGGIVAYQSYRTGTGGEIYIRSISGNSEEIKVSSAGGFDPAWSHDGHELFFRAAGQMMAARIVRSPRLHAESPSPLFPLEGFHRSPVRSVYDVFPNGDFVMTATRVDTGKVAPRLIVRLTWAAALAERGDRNR